jgi:hypothetical protein
LENNKISWREIFLTIEYFNKNREDILKNNWADWKNYLDELKKIEASIPTYEYYSTGVDNHSNWLVRIFKLFGRAFLEETEVKNSTRGKTLSLQWIDENSKYFHSGEGKPIADFIDKNNETYDVKHNSFDTSHAHNAKYLINYEVGGNALIRQVGSQEINVFDFCKSIRELEKMYGLPERFFDMNQAELEEFFGLQLK